MKPTGVNMTDVKQNNRSSVLRLLLTNGAMSRIDLANEMNLTAATLTTICRDFLQKGLLQQSDIGQAILSNRKKCPLEINRHFRHVIAISLHYTGHVIALTDLRGSAIATQHIAAEPDCDPGRFFKEIANLCIRMLWENGVSSDSVLGVGICVIGPVDDNRGIALRPFKTFAAANVPIKALLEREMPFPVAVENNVCSFLTAETLLGRARGNNLMAVKWGPGVGSASSIDGFICKDQRYHSAEIGHTYHYRDSRALCKCGHIGCLETGVSLTAISEEVRKLALASPALGTLIAEAGLPDTQNIAQYLALDCPPLAEMFDRCARDLAIGVSNAAQVFSPDQIILYGILFESEFLTERFLWHYREVNPYMNDELFVKSSLEDAREYIGPVATAIKQFLIVPGGEVVARGD